MTTISRDLYAPKLEPGEDKLQTIHDVLIGAACALEGVSAILDEAGDIGTASVTLLAYAADEIVCLQRALLNELTGVVGDLQKQAQAAKEAA